MLRQFRSRYCSFLGVDLRQTSIKIVQISQRNQQFCIEGYGYERFPANAFETSKDNVVSSIKKILCSINSKTTFAAIAVPDSTVISKTIQLVDSLNNSELETLIFLEADKHLAYPSNKFNIDYGVLGPSKKSFGMIDVLLLATREDNIRKRVNILTDAGLDIKVVDIESYVLASLFENTEKSSSSYLAIFDMGYDSIRLFILEKGKTIYTREDAFDCKVSIEEAIPCTNQNLKSRDYDFEILKPLLDSILLQIKRSLNYFFSTTDFHVIEKILLAGELSILNELPKLIQHETGFPTFVANPFPQLLLSKKINKSEYTKLAPLFLFALGLALRLANDN